MTPAAFFETDDRARLFWRLQVLGWGGTIFVTLGISGLLYSPALAGASVGFFRVVFGFLASSLILRPVLRIIRHRGGPLTTGHILVVLLFCGALGLVDTVSTVHLAQFAGLDLDQPGVRRFLAVSVFLRAVLYTFWSVLYFGVQYWLDSQQDRVRVAEVEAAARSSELQVLRSQVNPHFLFNALNSLLAESSNPESVRRITLALAEYLRFSLRQRAEEEELGVELDALENYLRVEKARFEDSLEYRIDADAAARRTLAPVALVQPLLENAIKYGQRSEIRPLRVTISAAIENGTLVVTVTNSGEWVVGDASTRTGLSNLRRRLDLLHPGQASLDLDAGNGEVRARVRLPAGSSS